LLELTSRLERRLKDLLPKTLEKCGYEGGCPEAGEYRRLRGGQFRLYCLEHDKGLAQAQQVEETWSGYIRAMRTTRKLRESADSVSDESGARSR